MKKWKLSMFVMVFLLMLGVMTACNSGSSGSSDDSGGDSGSENTEAEGSEGSSEEVTITYARGKDATGATDAIIKAFEEEHPNINVELREMPTDSGKQHDAYVTAFNAESSEIDVLDIDVVWPAEFAQAGYVLPLDRFIKKDNVNLDMYNEGALSAAQFKGKQWAMPKFIDAGMLFYRTDMVEEPPKTWDELISMASKLQGQKGTEFGYLMQAKQYEGLVCNAIEFIAAYGGAIVNEKGEVVVNSPDTIQGLKKLVEIATSDFVPQNITTFTEVESHTAFIEGESPFIRNWPYQFSLANDEEQSEIAGKVGVAPLPAGDEGSAAALGGWMTAISAFSENKQAAWEFVKFMTGKEGQKIDAIKGSHAPTIPELYEDEEIIAATPFFGEDGFVQALNAAVSRPVVPNYQEVSEIIQIHVSKAINGDVTVEEAVKSMETELKEALK